MGMAFIQPRFWFNEEFFQIYCIYLEVKGLCIWLIIVENKFYI